MDENKFNQYLYDEWKNEKNSDLFFYKSLTEYFKLHLKDIELKTDIQKNDLISQLGLCGSFAGTHAIISKLSRFSSWTNEQIIQLLQAATNNNQVWAIIDDFDIKIFYNSILKDKSTKFLDQSEFEWILERLGYKKE